VAVKASPLSALSVGEQPDLFIPLKKFNGNMQDVFANVAPHKANLVWESGPRRNRRRTSARRLFRLAAGQHRSSARFHV
jgi:hypothetical protein